MESERPLLVTVGKSGLAPGQGPTVMGPPAGADQHKISKVPSKRGQWRQGKPPERGDVWGQSRQHRPVLHRLPTS